MADTKSTLTVGITTPLRDDLVERIRSAHPDVDVRCDQNLLPPQRYPGDHTGETDFDRDEQQERAYWALVENSDVLYGMPNESVTSLERAVRESERLRWIQLMAAGGGAAVAAANVPIPYLNKVVFTTAAGVHGQPLAEYALMGVLMGIKDAPRFGRQQRAHHWPTVRIPNRSAEGSTVLVLGLGGIGQEFARLAKGLGMKVIGMKRTPEDLENVDRVVTGDSLPDVIGEADAIVATLPGTKETTGLLGEGLLSRAKDGVTVVNVGRGPVISEKALIAALKNGKVGCAVLDVTETEPLPKDSPLWDLDNVYLSPHSAALDEREDERICDLFIKNLTRFKDGDELENIVDPEIGY